MKLNELLEEAKMGQINYKRLKAIEHIHNTPEENKVSYLLKHALESLNEEKSIMEKLTLAYSQIKGYEERKRRGFGLNESFYRMKFDSLKSTMVELSEAVNKEDEYVNEELLGNAIALVQYSFNEVSENCKKDVKLPELKLQKIVNEEYELIKDNI